MECTNSRIMLGLITFNGMNLLKNGCRCRLFLRALMTILTQSTRIRNGRTSLRLRATNRCSNAPPFKVSSQGISRTVRHQDQRKWKFRHQAATQAPLQPQTTSRQVGSSATTPKLPWSPRTRSSKGASGRPTRATNSKATFLKFDFAEILREIEIKESWADAPPVFVKSG